MGRGVKTIRQGDIVLIDFAPALGHEQKGKRPAIVISRAMFAEKTNQLIVCPITTKKKFFPTRVPLNPNAKTQGYIICDHIKTIDIEARKPVFLERADEATLDKVLEIVAAFIAKEEFESGGV
ncbi:MAG: type II toxin-antitoxin system PemK/MazF family toxin [Oscillospiraceae bacterium]|nr:type II toxin-antitoxin system PemK/MazF family toxin [Oscillospiraceae bacterium]